MSRYKFSFSVEGKTGKISMRLNNKYSAENLSALFNHTLAILESKAEEDEEDEEDGEEEEELEEDLGDDEPDISNFDDSSERAKLLNEEEVRLRVVYFAHQRKEAIVELLSGMLHLPEVQCHEIITNKVLTPPIKVDVAELLLQELKHMGVGVSIKKTSDEVPLFNGDEK